MMLEYLAILYTQSGFVIHALRCIRQSGLFPAVSCADHERLCLHDCRKSR